VVVLKDPVPVHRVCMTAWADADGTVYFYHDLYDRDQRLRKGLSRTEDLQPARASDLTAMDRIIEKPNDGAAAVPTGENDTAGA
jgi:hypothetical protein